MEERFSSFVEDAFSERILPFDKTAAYSYGDIAALREKKGRHVDAVDLMIASIAKTTRAKIASRNIKDFEDCDVPLINPWKA